MRYPAAVSVALLSSLAGMAQEPEQHTIKSNLEYRLSRGDLPELTFGIEKPKNVEVTEGSEELLQDCLTDPVTWSQDPLVFRLAHAHAASIQSCRENRSPSMHVIFRKVGNEPLQAWVHLDGHGAQTSGSRMAHLGEFLYHKITLQNNDQNLMLENLERSFSSPLGTPPDATSSLSGRDRLTLFTDKTVTEVQPYASSLVSSAAFLLISPSRIWGQGADNYTNHLVASFSQRLVTYGLQSGAAAALHEDLRYRPLSAGTYGNVRARILQHAGCGNATRQRDRVCQHRGCGGQRSDHQCQPSRARELQSAWDVESGGAGSVGFRRRQSLERVQTRHQVFCSEQNFAPAMSHAPHQTAMEWSRWRKRAKYGAVRLLEIREISAGLPDATTRPPSSPAPGPISTT